MRQICEEFSNVVWIIVMTTCGKSYKLIIEQGKLVSMVYKIRGENGLWLIIIG